MVTWVDNGDGTASFDTSTLGTITVGSDNVFGTYIESIDSTGSLYHEYDETNSLGIPVGSIDPQDLYDSLEAFPTPFGPTFAGPGFVTHEQVSDTMTVNYTAEVDLGLFSVPVHFLTPGIVVREIIVVDGMYAMRTYGIGNGIAPALNGRFADAVWTYADANLIDDLVHRVGPSIFDAIPQTPEFANTYVGGQYLDSLADLMLQEAGLMNSNFDLTNLDEALGATLRIILANGNTVSEADLQAMISRLGENSNWNAEALLVDLIDLYEQRTGNDVDLCFLAGTMIDMWPLDDGTPWQKAIEDIEAGDLVVSYDASGQRVPGKVTRTFRNDATHILDFWGTGVTPGHAYLCGSGKYAGQHIPLLDILREDAAIVTAEGRLMRACINAPVGSKADREVTVVTGPVEGGQVRVSERRAMRLGTRVITARGTEDCLLNRLEQLYGPLGEDGHFADGTAVEGLVVHWPWGETLPAPEDYILARSDVTLADIYLAAEWEQIKPRLPAPEITDAEGNLLDPAMLLNALKPRPNVPPAFAHRPDMPAKERVKVH